MDQQQEQYDEVVYEDVITESTHSTTGWKFWVHKLNDFWTDCVRVLKVTRKPEKEELKTIVKISGLGILAIGLLGFLVSLIREAIRSKGL